MQELPPNDARLRRSQPPGDPLGQRGQYSHRQYNVNNFPTLSASTYTQGAAVKVRTNRFEYATNNIDLVHVFDANGDLQAGYFYNSSHLPSRLTNALGEITYYTYDGTLLTSISRPSGLLTTNRYDANDRLETTIDLQINRTNAYTYLDGRLHTHTDERGFTVTNSWDALGRLTAVHYPDGTSTSNLYTLLDRGAVRDRLGNWTGYARNSMRQLTAITNALGHVTTFDYCTCGSLQSQTDPLGNTTSHYYDNAGRRLATVHPDGSAITNTYDLAGRLIITLVGAASATTNAYNVQGLLTTSSNAFGRVQSRGYNILDQVDNSVDANGIEGDFLHDKLGRLTRQSTVGDDDFGYSSTGLVAHTNALGKVTLFGNDPAGRRVAQTNANNEVLQFEYNPAGDLTKLVKPGEDVSWSYDLEGRLTNRIDGSTLTLTYLYDAAGRLTNRWSAAKGNTAYAYDALGNLTRVDYPSSTDIDIAYDANNRPTNRLDAAGTTRYTYTTGGLLQSEDGPWDNDTVSYTYDEGLRASLALQQPNASDWQQSYGYDAARRLTTLVSPADTFTFAYNPSAHLKVGGIGLGGGTSITNTYDSSARLTSTQKKKSSGTLKSHTYTYNDGSQRTRQTFESGNYVDYTYDNIGQLVAAVGKEPGGTTNRLHEQFGYKYDSAGNLSYRTNNALVHSFDVAGADQLNEITRSGTLTVAGRTTAAPDDVDVNSVDAALYSDLSFAVAGFALNDGLNSFTAKVYGAGGSPRDTNTVTVDLPATVAFGYDANGNLVTAGTRGFDYDDENQLIRIVQTNQWMSEFVYDGKMRRRIRKEFQWIGGGWIQSEEVRYVYDGNLVLQERDGYNLPRVTYTRGPDLSGTFEGAGGIGGLLARTDHGSGASAFYHADGNGNVTSLTDADGAFLAQYHYDPFGNIVAQSGPLALENRYRFSSKEADEASGLVYYLYRYYDPGLQRWPNRDPIEEMGGLNLYRFVGNNPLSRVDVFGLLDPGGKPFPKTLPKTCPSPGPPKPGPVLFFVWWGLAWYGVGEFFSDDLAECFVPDDLIDPKPIPCPKPKAAEPAPDEITCKLVGSSLSDPEKDPECYYLCTGPDGYEEPIAIPLPADGKCPSTIKYPNN